MPGIQDRLNDLGLELPPAPRPVASYIPAVRTGSLLFVSGQIPLRAGAMLAVGRVPDVVPVETAQECARQCVLNALAVVADMLEGDLERVRKVVRVGVFVSSAPGFTDQPLVANGASELLQELLGEAGRHARAAVGSVALPLDAPVEVEMVVEVA